MPKTHLPLFSGGTTGHAPHGSTTTTLARHELTMLVLRAATIADELELWDVGISLDAARLDLERLAGALAEHATAQ